jgi:hypothetical protein
MGAIKSQQFRWTKGGAETAKKNIGMIWNSSARVGQKIHGTAHLLSSSVFLCVLICSLLSFPLLLIKNALTGYATYFLIMSFFLISLIILSIFYFFSIYRRCRSGFHALVCLFSMFPIFLSMSMGISLHNAVAVLEGWLGFKSPFIRTPKFNFSQKSTSRDKSWKANKYLAKSISLLSLFEGFLAAYFLSAVASAFLIHDWGLLPFHLMLTIGFGTVFFYTVKHSSPLK